MKEISYIIALFFLVACKKDEDGNQNSVHSCDAVVSAESYLVGKWKLLNWTTAHYNTTPGFCDVVGGNTYVANDWGKEAYLEIEQGGIFRTYIGDSLVNEAFAHKAVKNETAVGYVVNCQNMNFGFYCLNYPDGNISNTSLGDTLRIDNPFLDLNFANEPVWSITSQQQYVKIE